MNYYNENDPRQVAWLRELIKQGHIAEGEVDEQSIVDVQPGDLAGFVQCHFFAGIGGWSAALRLAGWCDDEPVWTGSCPCQPFSIAGKAGGVCDERHLWPAFRRLIAKRGPAIVFGEQVASKDGRAWLAGVRSDLEGDGYAVGGADLCAASVGAPHIRQRLYWCASKLADTGSSSTRTDSKRGELDGKTQALKIAGRWETAVESGGRGGAGGMAESDGGKQRNGGIQRGGQHGQQPQDGGTSFAMAESDGRGCEERAEQHGDPEQNSTDGSSRGQHAGGCGESGGMADLQQSGLEGQSGHERNGSEPGRIGAETVGSTSASGGSGGVADAERDGRGTGGNDHRKDVGAKPDADGDAGGVGVADGVQRAESSGDRSGSGKTEGAGAAGKSARSGDIGFPLTPALSPSGGEGESRPGPGGLAHAGYAAGCAAESKSLQKCDAGIGQSSEVGDPGTPHPGPLPQWGSGWSNWELVPCRDGKARRIESGTFPLVAGLPRGVVPSGDPSYAEAQATAESRVARLRGYGNSIVPQLAAEFIRASIEAIVTT